MSALNKQSNSLTERTYENAKVLPLDKRNQLVRMTMAHMLWENQFYVNGEDSSKILQNLVKENDKQFVSQVAKKARSEFKLRHVPLLLMRELARDGRLNSDDLTQIIERPDELGEFVSIYWKEGKQPLSNQVKKGLGNALTKFNEYQLAKWDKNSAAVSLRDVMFLTHPKPKNAEQAELFKKLANKQLETPDTWEVNLSAGKDKKKTFEDLMQAGKLGALAFLRNLRNMVNSGVDENLIRNYADNLNVEKVLPFRFIAAANHAPNLKGMLEELMFKCLQKHEKLPGKTVLLIDVSGSMFGTKISNKSDLDRFSAAAALAILCREICEKVEIYTFSDHLVRVDNVRGFALVDALKDSQEHGGTYLGNAVDKIHGNFTSYDRMVVFTDEQTADRVPNPEGKGYVINVAAYKNGINHSKWLTISGFSEAIIDYIQLAEKLQD